MKQLIYWFFCGILIALSDLVPGVSGSTLALVLGVYILLINTIKHASQLGLSLVRFRLPSLKQFFQIHWRFLIALGAGYLTSLLILSQFIHHLILQKPVFLFSFLLGLAAFSAATLLREHTKTWRHVAWAFLGVCLGGALLLFSPQSAWLSPSLVGFFVSGVIGVVLMLIPGISGSYVLLQLGMYEPLIQALSQREWINILCVVLGVLAGGFLSIRLIHKLLSSYQAITINTMAGVILGSSFLFVDRIIVEQEKMSLKVPSVWVIVFVALGAALALVFFFARIHARKRNLVSTNEMNEEPNT